jgi:hypothetical protein
MFFSIPLPKLCSYYENVNEGYNSLWSWKVKSIFIPITDSGTNGEPTNVRRSRRLSSELNVLQEDPISMFILTQIRFIVLNVNDHIFFS